MSADRSADPSGPRRSARERALELLYEAESKDVSPLEVLRSLPVAPDPYAITLVEGVCEHQAEIDARLSGVSEHWDLERMPMVDRAVLRVATFELAHRGDVPAKVVINEAVELAKQYSTDDSGRFVNGLLSRMGVDLRPGELTS